MRLSFAMLALAFSVLTPPSAAQQTPALTPPVVETRSETPTETAAETPTTRGRRAAPLTAQDLDAWFGGFLPYALQRGGIAGAMVAVVKDGEVLFQSGYGWADVENRVPVDAERTLFRPGSVSKLFTWTAVMQLVEQGRIDLDRDINAYLDFEIPERDGKPITMRDVMTHTPGFEERVKGLIGTDPDALAPLGEFLARWVPGRVYRVGTTPAYSNYATGLAGYIVERVSGQSFDDYIDEHIFAPLGMNDSSFRQPLPDRLAGQMSKGYSVASEPPEPYEIVQPAPAGSLASTAADMAKFMIAHLQGGQYGDEWILNPDTARLMHDTRLTLLPPLNRMALGFFESQTNGYDVIGHGGDTQWFHTGLYLFMDEGIGLYFSVNSMGKDGAAGPLRGALFEMFADRYLPGPSPTGSVDPELAAKHAAIMAGTYEVSRRSHSNFLAAPGLLGQVKVADNGDGTITVSGLDDLAGAPNVWREIEPFVWVGRNSDSRLAARVVDGEVRRFSMDDFSPFMVFEPIAWWQSSVWLLPALNVALAILLLTVLLWPVRALVRQHYDVKLPLAGADLRAYRWVRIAALAALLVLAGWMILVTVMSSDLSYFSGRLDPWLLLLQLLSLLVFFGLLIAALWNAQRVWTGDRRWPAKTWSVALVFAAIPVLWVAFAFNLIGFGTDY